MKLKNNMDPKYTKISAYVIVTFFILYCIVRLGDQSGRIVIAVGTFLHAVGVVLKPLLWGFVFAYMLYPLVNKLEGWLAKRKHYIKKGKSPRNAAVAIVMISLIAAVVLLLSLIISMVTKEVRLVNLDDLTNIVQDFGRSLQSLYSALRKLLAQINVQSDDLETILNRAVATIGTFAQETGNNILSSLSNFTSFFASLMFALILCIYFLADAKNLMVYWDRAFAALSPKKFYAFIHMLINDANAVFSGYIRGQVMDALFMAIAASVVLSIINVPLAILIGVMTGIGNLVPYLGPVFAYGGTIFACLLTGDMKKLLIAIIAIFILQTIDGNVVNPKLLSNAIEIHPMLVIVALIIGSAAGGLLGMLLAVPVAGLIKVWFDRTVNEILTRREEYHHTHELDEKNTSNLNKNSEN